MYIGSTGRAGPAPPRLRGRRQLDRRGAGRLLRPGQRHASTSTTRSRSSTTAAAFRSTMHASGKSAAEVVLTVLHAGGKFDNDSYKVSGGLHGVGVSVVNALSETLELEIWRDGQVYQQSYERGKPDGRPRGRPARRSGAARRSRFKPDAQIFETTEFSFDTLAQRLRELAFLNGGVTITLDDERDGQEPRVPLRGRHRRVRRAPEQEQGGRQRQADLHARREGRHRRRDRAAVERRLRRDGLLVRQQHQHARRRHAPLRASARR